MLSRATARRAFAAVVATAAVASVGATTADAKVVTVTDDTAAEFSDPQATQGNTVVRTLAGGDGAVELARPVAEEFDGVALTAPWSSAPWDAGGVATVANGAVLVDGTWLNSGVPVGPGSTVQFSADFGADPVRHVGFAADFNAPPWAIFSARRQRFAAERARAHVRRRRRTGGPGHALHRHPGAAHLPHRLDDRRLRLLGGRHSRSRAMRSRSRARCRSGRATSRSAGAVYRSRRSPSARHSGVFTSRPLDAGDARVTGLSLAPTGDAPTGTAIAYETRSAGTAGGLSAAPWQALDAGSVASAAARFLQYRASMTTPDPAVTPRLDKVDVGFTIDDQAPNGHDPGRRGVRLRRQGHVQHRRRRGGRRMLAGRRVVRGVHEPRRSSPASRPAAHTIVVRATDAFDNVGSATRAFDVAQPPPSGGAGTPPPPSGGTQPPTGAAPDRTAPKVLVTGRSLRVSSSGVAKLAVRCPRSEVSCAVTVKLTLAGKSVARKTLTLSSGSTRSFRLKLSKAARRALAARSKLAATAVVTAADAAGNRKTTTRGMTLRGAAG